jgi:exopolysaccharide biosynthesis polyprenyl glycosylphosphotransferase
MGEPALDPNAAASTKPIKAIGNGQGRAIRFVRRAYLGLAVAVALLTDVILINVAFALAYYIRYELHLLREVAAENYVPFSAYPLQEISLTAILLLVFALEGLYSRRRPNSWFEDVYTIAKGTFFGIAMMIVIVFIAQPFFYSRLIFVYTGVFTVILLAVARLAGRVMRSRLRRRGIGMARTLVVGAGEVGRAVMRNAIARPDLGYQVVGFVDDDPEKFATDLGRFKALGSTYDTARVVQEQDIDMVIVTLPWISHRKIMGIMEECEKRRVGFKLVPDMFQMSLSQVGVDDIDGIPLITVREVSIPLWGAVVKRVIDVAVASLGLLLLSPILIAIGVLIKLDSPGPALFRQARVGKGGRHFTVFKYRTMRQDAEQLLGDLAAFNEATGPLFKIRDDPRVTRVGKWVRRLSIDEIPQLINVLLGQMSLVGPRPALPKEVTQYEEWHRKRLEVAPGMTSLWAVSGRSDVPFDEMVMLDIYYIENWSLRLDFTIILRTPSAVFTAAGAY